ncbi:MAG: peptidoglycan-associated lipoprotein Pal [Candidatus Acidiferrales bacterium]
MRSSSLRKVMLTLGVAALVVAGGCKKKVATAPPAATPAAPPAQPTVTLNASPTSVNAGQTSTLSWSSTNATDLDIQPGVGKVSPEGSTAVTPTESTSYTITASGPGGSATASAQVTVNAPPPAQAAAPSPSVEELFNQNVHDAFFDTDKSELRPDARDALTKDAEFLRSYPDVRISLEGHCDERGSTEYNLGLGERRADAAKNYLVSLGIAANRIDTVSWGKERAFCTEHNESCWQQNRRAHFVMGK